MTVTVSIANTGGVEGTCSLVLKINGVKEAEKSVSVTAGKSQNVSFTVSKKDAGSYTVDVDGLTAGFSVVAPPPVAPAPPEVKAPINWPLIAGIIVAVILAGLLVFFLLRRRRYA